MSAIEVTWEPFAKTLNTIVQQSIEGYYNPYKTFDWPDQLEAEQWWMTPELLSVHGTRFFDELSESQLMALSKWESMNFYSLNVHGIRELLLEVTKRIHSPGFEVPSEFFHHFIGEENEHMWFFAEFCKRYGRLYPDKRIKLAGVSPEPAVESFLVFARILIFEDIVDHFNIRMGSDESLHPFIQKINRVHHQDESRHIIFGRQIVKQLFEQFRDRLSEEQRRDLDLYLKRYIMASINSLYNPAAYKDAGIPDPYGTRTAVLGDGARKAYHERYLKRTITFLVKSGILTEEDFVS